MTSHASVAKSVREDKEAHPEKYCRVKGCLWRVQTRNGINPCRKHPEVQSPLPEGLRWPDGLQHYGG